MCSGIWEGLSPAVLAQGPSRGYHRLKAQGRSPSIATWAPPEQQARWRGESQACHKLIFEVTSLHFSMLDSLEADTGRRIRRCEHQEGALRGSPMRGSDCTPGRVCVFEDSPGRKRPGEEPWGPRGSNPGARHQPTAIGCINGYRCSAAFAPGSACRAPCWEPRGWCRMGCLCNDADPGVDL